MSPPAAPPCSWPGRPPHHRRPTTAVRSQLRCSSASSRAGRVLDALRGSRDAVVAVLVRLRHPEVWADAERSQPTTPEVERSDAAISPPSVPPGALAGTGRACGPFRHHARPSRSGGWRHPRHGPAGRPRTAVSKGASQGPHRFLDKGRCWQVVRPPSLYPRPRTTSRSCSSTATSSSRLRVMLKLARPRTRRRRGRRPDRLSRPAHNILGRHSRRASTCSPPPSSRSSPPIAAAEMIQITSCCAPSGYVGDRHARPLQRRRLGLIEISAEVLRCGMDIPNIKNVTIGLQTLRLLNTRGRSSLILNLPTPR